MKSLISKKNQDIFSKIITINKLSTRDMILDCVDVFGLGYVIRHFEIDEKLFPLIACGEFSETCDEEYTISEIEKFQKTLTDSIISKKTS